MAEMRFLYKSAIWIDKFRCCSTYSEFFSEIRFDFVLDQSGKSGNDAALSVTNKKESMRSLY